ncbi:hypothetical protein T484DRAFT_1754568 [Baffinella frigidus]|nr:hypothetical protein T484DRAFT_1754568 [Cryptophyta sp. CCMP2293]
MDGTLKRTNAVAFPALPSVPSTAFPVLTAHVPVIDAPCATITSPLKRHATSSNRVAIGGTITIHGKVDDGADMNAAKKDMKKSRKLLLAWTQSFTRSSAIECKHHVDEDDIGSIFFEENGESFGCPISAVHNILQNGLIKDLDCKDPDGVMAFTQGECGNLSDFPNMLETLASKLMEGAHLAREGGFEQIPPIDDAEHDRGSVTESLGSTTSHDSDESGSDGSDSLDASDGTDESSGGGNCSNS